MPELLTVPTVLADVVAARFRSDHDAGRDCRLLLPGLTDTIAAQLHSRLIELLNGIGVPVYLTARTDQVPDETVGLVPPIALTSVRIGSFICIAAPGHLSHIQDSVRGTGGTIRGPVYSEEWPWIDDGSEHFRFHDVVLPRLTELWSDSAADRGWLAEIVTNVLIKNTQSNHRRGQTLLEEMLGKFTLQRYPEISGVKPKFLRHIGIALPDDDRWQPQTIRNDAERLSRGIFARCNDEPEIRRIVHDQATPEIRAAVSNFLDGLGTNWAGASTPLAFLGCWYTDSDWKCLSARKLRELFSLERDGMAKDIMLDSSANTSRGISKGRDVVTFNDSELRINVRYSIPDHVYEHNACKLHVKYRSHLISEHTLRQASSTVALEIDLAKFIQGQRSSTLAKKIPLRLELLAAGDCVKSHRFGLYICSDFRPYLVVVSSESSIVLVADAVRFQASDELTPESVRVDGAVSVHLAFGGEPAACKVTDERGMPCVLHETDSQGLLRLDGLLNPSVSAGGVVTRSCIFNAGQHRVDVTIEAESSIRGEFTLEQELIVLMSAGPAARADDIKRLYRIFSGKQRQAYTRLGGISERTRFRNVISDIMTRNTNGWRPILVDLFDSGGVSERCLGDYARSIGNISEDAFCALRLSGRPLGLLEDYALSRSDLIALLDGLLDKAGRGEHPTYACCPTYVDSTAGDIEVKINSYVSAYTKILQFLDQERTTLDWAQLFVLTHLDCVVHWDEKESSLRNQVFLVGPWHPLMVASRFMLQNAVFLRAHRLVVDGDKSFRFLCSLLGSVHGFRWLPCVASDDRELVPALVALTSDPGWRLATTGYVHSDLARDDVQRVIDILMSKLDLATDFGLQSSSSLHVSSLRSFQRAFPSRRSVGLRVSRGTSSSEVVRTVDGYLHGTEARDIESLLPGGVRLYFDEIVGEDIEAEWIDPPLEIYSLANSRRSSDQLSFDLHILSPSQSMKFKADVDRLTLPRGRGREYVFSRGLSWLTEGSQLIPTSIAYEYDCPDSDVSGDVGERVASALYHLDGILDGPIATMSKRQLPRRLEAPWVVLPGKAVDPAVLVQYVRDGVKRQIEERALWDYRVDVSGGVDDSYFVLSAIPNQFVTSVHSFFGISESAATLVTDLGSCGIAIGSESLRSGQHALGVIGLVAAVKLLLGTAADGTQVIRRSEQACGFVLPIDSFGSFFGRGDTGYEGRGDLLAVQMRIVSGDESRLRLELSAAGVEAKFVSGTFHSGRADAALQQARNSEQEFSRLVQKSLCAGGMPERLALLEILAFGLRISSPDEVSDRSEWVVRQSQVYRAVLSGRYGYRGASYRSVLVSTEGGLEGVPECKDIGDGIWIRLTRRHWPDVANSGYVEAVRARLALLFEFCDSNNGQYRSDGLTGVHQRVPPVSTGIHKGSSEVQGAIRRFTVGVDEARSQIYFDPHSSTRSLENVNVMVTGSSGMGKTQFLKYMICKITDQKNGVLILDLKNDFASDDVFCGRAGLRRAFVAFDGLPINPLIPYPIPHPATGKLFMQCSQHISGIAYLLKQSYGLGAQQEASIKNAITDSFVAAGIDPVGSVEFSTEMIFPDFSTVGTRLRESNPSAYNRLDPLFTLDLFRKQYRNSGLADLFAESIVLDFSQIPSDDLKNALAQMIIMAGSAYLNALPQSGTVRQFLFVDEAHRVLNSRHLVSLVRQCRSYGISTVLSSQ